MASALLASRNEPYWGDTNTYMRNPNPRSGAPIAGGHYSSGDYGVGPAVVAAAARADDSSSSFNRNAIGDRCHKNSSGLGAYVTFSVSNYSKREQRDLRRRLESELEQVRRFTTRIESKELGFQARGAVAPVGSLAAEGLKDRKLSGSKNLLPSVPPRETKRMVAAQEELRKMTASMMKRCGQMLSKLMKQKKSVWFNSPVDVTGMGLHDYFQIVKNPMDLGTVKLRLNKGLYANPVEFAADIRLTFNNALLYNPQGHEVYNLAGQYLRMFEGMFGPAYAKYEQQLNSVGRGEQQLMSVKGVELARNKNLYRPSVPKPDVAMRSDFAPLGKVPTPPLVPISSPMQAMSSVQAKQPHMQSSKAQSPVEQQQKVCAGRMIAGKQPKLRAKDLNKRPMSYEEKQKLGFALESLPYEKMAEVLQIVSKRNGQPMQDGDEIELDIEIIDTETLWELDRFVSNCKKMMSKVRRQEEARASAPISAGHSPATAPQIAEASNRSPIPFDTPVAVAAKRSRKLDTGEEDVDIGDEMPVAHYPSVEIEKNAVDAKSSSSSDSDSSSDDSDSDSSSGSDSDEND